MISGESRARTGISGEAFPVRINGVQRSWSLAAPNYHMTAVGVAVNPNSYINGNIFPVPEEELANFDTREIGYDRKSVNSGDISMVLGKEVPNGAIWIYTGQKNSKPSIHL